MQLTEKDAALDDGDVALLAKSDELVAEEKKRLDHSETYEEAERDMQRSQLLDLKRPDRLH